VGHIGRFYVSRRAAPSHDRTASPAAGSGGAPWLGIRASAAAVLPTQILAPDVRCCSGGALLQQRTTGGAICDAELDPPSGARTHIDDPAALRQAQSPGTSTSAKPSHPAPAPPPSPATRHPASSTTSGNDEGATDSVAPSSSARAADRLVSGGFVVPDLRLGQPLRFLTSAVACGSTENRSPTTPKSTSSKIGASSSLLMAMIVFEVCMPARCWMAPEMPAAT